MIPRLEDDHRNAKTLAKGLSTIKGISVNLQRVQTNIVYFEITDSKAKAEVFTSKLKENGLLALPTDKNRIRMVTHRGIERTHIEIALGTIETVAKNLRRENKSD
jgi:threonine aldolase